MSVVTDPIKSVGEDIWDGVSDVSEDIWHTVADPIGKGAEDIGKGAENLVSGSFDKVIEGAGSVVKDVGTGIGSAVEPIAPYIGDIMHGKTTAQQTFERKTDAPPIQSIVKDDVNKNQTVIMIGVAVAVIGTYFMFGKKRKGRK